MIPDLQVGDEIRYREHVGPRKYKEKVGIITEDAGKYWVIRLGKYRDTLLKNDLITKEIKIVDVKKGVEIMPRKDKLEVPSKEILEGLFQKAEGNISRAAKLCDPPVSDVTMGRWLRDAEIIPTEGIRNKTVPAADELRAAWEEGKHTLTAVAKKYDISPMIAKRWLKAAGIIKEGLTGIVTIPLPNIPLTSGSESEKASSDFSTLSPTSDAKSNDNNADTGEKSKEIQTEASGAAEKPYPNNEELWKSLSYISTKIGSVSDRLISLEKKVGEHIADPEDVQDQERIKKLVNFFIAPAHGRIDKLEESLASVARIILDKDTSDDTGDILDKLDLMAELIVRVASRLSA